MSPLCKVVIPNEVNDGFDYRAPSCPPDGGGIDSVGGLPPRESWVGEIVQVSVGNKLYDGLVVGPGDGGIAPEKIKPIIRGYGAALPAAGVDFIKKMSEWTMMPMGAIWKLMSSASQLGMMNEESGIKRPAPHSSFLIPNYKDTGKIALNDEQAAAAAAIKLGAFSVHLLDGITGSGKTQVYFDAAMRAYESGRQVLLMMPEISLTAQFSGRFKERFGAAPIIWHSSQTPAKRRKIWHGVLSGRVRMVVGTRSALLLPWQDLGLIVVDEEHDSSYKQEEMGTYHARDMAVLYGKISDIPVVLASATPSFETLANAAAGKYSVSRLTARYAGAALPRIIIADMRKKK